ncbi:conserved protein of unknown function [Candidatus Bipolaricaulis anaerobius]|jgi:hypothetical protein|uniref:PIN domain-containing protein n=1 Tax=Candidatus Bipolaricaulis anaerobius TaxID=2026885 RepID=A0A2X3KKZ9_9BACT|nr:hypothetical protein [Candidatus Bipolaricaulis anaerobius]SQD93122.1 conserved protein of unknown function [Candidatus Bipolaricaulis anaerobius]
MRRVVDVNVLVVANERCDHATERCVLAVTGELSQIVKKANEGSLKVVIDAGDEILKEYGRHASRSGRPGAGDFFFKWLWDRQTDPHFCEQASVNRDAQRGYSEFPADQDLAAFDRGDRIYVAVAIVSGADVVNAVDTDWAMFEMALRKNGVRVKNLCADMLQHTGGGNSHGDHKP